MSARAPPGPSTDHTNGPSGYLRAGLASDSDHKFSLSSQNGHDLADCASNRLGDLLLGVVQVGPCIATGNPENRGDSTRTTILHGQHKDFSLTPGKVANTHENKMIFGDGVVRPVSTDRRILRFPST